MNQNLLFIAKAIGDLKVSMNGEGCVGFSVKEVWTNFVTFELMGDQGNLFTITDNPKKPCALENLGVLLSVMKIVPHGNDQMNCQYVTDGVVTWVKTQALTAIKEGFAHAPDAFKLTLPFKEGGRTLLTLTVEIMLNKHVQAMLHLVERAEFISPVSGCKAVSKGEETGYGVYGRDGFTLLHGAVLYKQFGLEDIRNAKYHYCLNVNPNDTSYPTHILTANQFDFSTPRASRAISL